MGAVGEHTEAKETADRGRRRAGRGCGRDGGNRSLPDDLRVDRIVHGSPDEIPIGGEGNAPGEIGTHRVRFGAGRDLGAHQAFIDQLPHEGRSSLRRLLQELRLAGRVEEIAAKLSGDPNEVGNQAFILGPRVGVRGDPAAKRRHLLIPVLERLLRFAYAGRALMALVVVKSLDVHLVCHGQCSSLFGECVLMTRTRIVDGIYWYTVLTA